MFYSEFSDARGSSMRAIHCQSQDTARSRIKIVLDYLKGMTTEGWMMKHDPEKGIKRYIDAGFVGGCNQEEGKEPRSALSITG